MEKKIKASLIVLVLIILGVICFGLFFNKNQKSNGGDSQIDADGQIINNEQALSLSTHIFDAEYLGKEENFCCFQVKTVIKQPEDDLSEDRVLRVWDTSVPTPKLAEGHEYFLTLQKIVFVYEDAGIFYNFIGDSMISPDDAAWNSLHEAAQKMLKDGKAYALPYIGTRFTTSDVPKEVIDYSAYIFRICVEELIYDGSLEGINRDAYRCRIEAILKGNPDYQGDIITSYYTGTVNIGNEYIVLLEQAGAGSKVFPISSRSCSIYTIEEAEKIPALKNLMEKEKETSYPEEGTDYLTDLRKEWEWGVENGIHTEFYYSEETGCRIFFNQVLFEIEGSGEMYDLLVSRVSDFGTTVMKDYAHYWLKDEASGILVKAGSEQIEVSVDSGNNYVVYHRK